MAKKDPNFGAQGKRGGMGGKYGSKSTNLSKSILKKAGAAKAAKKATVSQSATKRVGSRTVGPKGKPVTGTVTLSDGSKAVYKNGRRVQAADARKPASKPTRSRSASTGSTLAARPAAKPTANPNAGVAVGTVRAGVHGRKNRWDGKRWVRVETAGAGYQAGRGQTSKPAPSKPAPSKPASKRGGAVPQSAYSSQVPRDNSTVAESAYRAAVAKVNDIRKHWSDPMISGAEKKKTAAAYAAAQKTVADYVKANNPKKK